MSAIDEIRNSVNYGSASATYRSILELASRIAALERQVADHLRDTKPVASHEQGDGETQGMVDYLASAIRAALDAHHQEVYLTCPETCWCWDLEQALTNYEAVNEARRTA